MNAFTDTPNTKAVTDPWEGFSTGAWRESIDVRGFIQENYTPYEGDAGFLAGPTARTAKLWDEIAELSEARTRKGCARRLGRPPLDDHRARCRLYRPRRRADRGPADRRAAQARDHAQWRAQDGRRRAQGLRLRARCDGVGIWTKYRKSHNQGVFDAYSPDILAARKSGIITGLPDAYGRGRIIGDYRRVALYGVDRLRQAKLGE
jgi:formate C-acetyltransferase